MPDQVGDIFNKDSPEKPLNKRAAILRKAEELINGDRAQTYGPPEISFGRIADLWNAMGFRKMIPHPSALGTKNGAFDIEELDAIDVALALVQLKVSRAIGSNGESLDDWLDMAGYTGLGGEMAMNKKERNHG